MKRRITCDGAVIIGAMTPPSSRSPFNRGHLVIRTAGGEITRAQTFTADGHAEGPALTPEDWQELLESEQTLALPGETSLTPGAALWVLRPGFHRRDRALQDLQSHGVLLRHPSPDRGSWLCLVDESRPAAAELRDRWRQEASEEALKFAAADQWTRGLDEAELAQAVSRGLDPESLALLHLVYRNLGRHTGADGLIEMARRSRGEPFVARLHGHLDALHTRLAASRLRPAPLLSARPTPKHAQTWRARAQASHRGALDHLLRPQDAA